MALVPPTAAELARARREGRVPFSSIAVFAAAWCAVRAVLPALEAEGVRAMRTMLGAIAMADPDPVRDSLRIVREAWVPVVGTLAAACVAAMFATFAQTRFARIPRAGSKPVDPPRVQSAVIGFVAAVMVLAVCVVSRATLLDALTVALLAAAAVDLAWRHWHWRRALHTSDADRRREARDDEIPAEIKRERDRRGRE